MKEHPFSKEKIANFFEGSLPELQHTEVLTWFSSLSEKDQLEFMELHFNVIGKATADETDTLAGDFTQLQARILNKKEARLRAGTMVLKIAAAVLPFIAGYLLFVQPNTTKKIVPKLNVAVNIKTIQISNLLPTTENIQLPDSSTVTLYPGATLNYPEGLKGKKREIQLTGKAFFKVKHEQHRPFTVQTGKITTVVLGTSFWVEAVKNAGIISVKVKTGKVGVVHGNEPAVFLLPTEKAIFNRMSGVLAKVKQPAGIKPTLKLHNNQVPAALVFNETPLKQVAEVIADNFKFRITVAEGVHADLPITLNTKNKTITQIMQDIKAQIPIDYEIKNQQIIISKHE